MNLYVYEYTGEQPADFPTLGLRDVKKGDQIESPDPLVSDVLNEITDKKAKGSDL